MGAVGDLRLPPAPPIKVIRPDGETTVTTTIEGAPTPQARETAKDGGPLDALATCRWCGGMHPTACPYIKVAEWHKNGQLSRVVLEERGPQKAAILYPYEEDEDALRRALTAIVEATDLERAQGLARTVLQLLEQEDKTPA